MAVGQNFVDSKDFKNPIKTNFDWSVIEPIDLKLGAKFSSTLATIQSVDLTLIDLPFNPLF